MDDRNSEVVREHLQKKLFPPMAYCKVLLSEGYDRETALAYVKKATHKASCVKKRGNAQTCQNVLLLYDVSNGRKKAYAEKFSRGRLGYRVNTL